MVGKGELSRPSVVEKKRNNSVKNRKEGQIKDLAKKRNTKEHKNTWKNKKTATTKQKKKNLQSPKISNNRGRDVRLANARDGRKGERETVAGRDDARDKGGGRAAGG